MRVTTWNVLHRIHAVNWNEAPIASFPDERARTTTIAERVAFWLEGDVDAVCLQEVSGDQLARIREQVGSRMRVFTHRYARVPGLHEERAPELDDPSEQLVVIVKSGAAHLVKSCTFDSDPGKGYLAVATGGLLLVCTHVSSRERGPAQIEAIAAATKSAARVVVAGDFNAPRDVVSAGLGDAFTLTATSEWTRILTDGRGGKTIDHVAARGARIASVCVLDADGVSDHQPVSAEIGLA